MGKQPCMLPWAGEWRKLVSQVEPDFHVEPDVSRANAEQIVVSGLLRLLPGTSWSVTAPYHWSMDEQWRYWAKPIDAFFANVDKYRSLEEPTAAHFRQRKAGRSRGVCAEFLAARSSGQSGRRVVSQHPRFARLRYLQRGWISLLCP